ncbi:MAG TPA: acylneuraminate cytidylyltransferase family protein [Melioribacteraceae bacterium]|nr:acylneuraminate cytidylyltransferase family protein [Melioribacteraceae bacterium]
MANKIVAIIPARGGSKGIKNKNLYKFIDKPLIAWSILSAQNSGIIDSVYVSSDSNEILNTAVSFGAKTIKRPDILANDIIMPDAALFHALNYITEPIEYIVFLQPTSPLRKNDDIKKAIFQIKNENADSLLSGVPAHHFIWSKKKKYFHPLNYDYLKRPRRQDFFQYVENGSIYIFKPWILKKNKNRLGGKITLYEMEDWQLYQIDSPDDIHQLEAIYERHRNHFIKEGRK